MHLFKPTLVMILAGASLWAQQPLDTKLRAQFQVFGEGTSFRKGPYFYVAEGGQVYRTDDQAKDQSSWGLRASFGLDQASHWNLELAVRAKKVSHFQYVGPISPSFSVDNRGSRLEYGWWGPGLSYGLNMTPYLRANLGMEYRIERFTIFNPNDDTETTIYNRPWARASLALELPIHDHFHPIIGAEFCVPLIQKNIKDWSPTQYLDPEDMRRRMAPNSAVSVFLGARF